MGAKLNPWVDADRRLLDFQRRVARGRLEPRLRCWRTWRALPPKAAWLIVGMLLAELANVVIALAW